MQHRLLVVDDDARDRDRIKSILRSKSYVVDVTASGNEAIAKVKENLHAYSVVILDYRMGDKNGADVAQEISALDPSVFILIYSGDDTREALKQSLRAGVMDFIDKGVDDGTFLASVSNWCSKYEHTRAIAAASLELDANEKLINSVGMVGRSAALAAIAREIIKYRDTNARIMLIGERGVGKEVVANALHAGPGEFVPFSCAQWTNNPELMLAEIFGSVKGAFTGAKDRIGGLRKARHGTFFIDELTRLSMDGQIKFLRALQEKKAAPLGDDGEYGFDCRIISAAQPVIFSMLKAGEFAEDLWDRLNVKQIIIPTIAERPEDIEPLILHFVKMYSAQYKLHKCFRKRTIRTMEKYHWPGNVREISNVVETLVIGTPAEQCEITPDDLGAKFFDPAANLSEGRTLEEATKNVVEEALRTTKSLAEAARKLGIPRTTLHDMVNRLGLSNTRRKAG